jgi:hypothetical protein
VISLADQPFDLLGTARTPGWVRFGQIGWLRLVVLADKFNILADVDEITLSVDDA